MDQCLIDHFLKEFLLLGHGLLLRIENFFFLGAQFIGVEPLRIGHGLFAYIMLRDQM